ncbi:MAG: hypothetical protein EHM49_09740 [Deltaproteobacteria bacterium]|nr:MAG: hypothetical protein EHM49_09740 [Deltaproteobacteria bacterium]
MNQVNSLLGKLEMKGFNEEMVANKLLELLDYTTLKFDKNGNSFEVKDGNLSLKVIELWMKLRGVGQTKNNHLHITEATLDRLLGKGEGDKAEG